jgi:DNA-binding transcriptional ArsR family regulator
MGLGTFELDALKALRDSDPLTPTELLEGDMFTNDQGRIVRRAPLVGPLSDVQKDLKKLAKRGLVIEDEEGRWTITERGEQEIEAYYERLRKEIARRYAGERKGSPR